MNSYIITIIEFLDLYIINELTENVIQLKLIIIITLDINIIWIFFVLFCERFFLEKILYAAKMTGVKFTLTG